MRSERAILHRVAALGLTALVAVAGLVGCSSVEPTDSWASDTGTLTGMVRSDSGSTLSEIEVWLWTELGAEGREVCYQTETDVTGRYEFQDVEMAGPHSFEETYWLCANRTPDRSSSIDADFSTCRHRVTVPRAATRTDDIVLQYIGAPDDPDSYIDG